MALPEDGKCPNCRAELLPGANKCHACGSVWGEDNRCPSCHSVSPVTQSRDGYVCLACGAPRQMLPGTTLVGNEPLSPVAARGRSTGMRVLGVLMVGTAITLAALSGAVIGGVGGVVVAAGIGALGIGVGMRLMRGASAPAVQQRAQAHVAGSLADLARDHGGVLRAKDVAAAKGISEADAEAQLMAIADGMAVGTEVTEDGDLRYRFFDQMSSVRARVEVEEAEGVGVPAAAQTNQKEREL